MRTRIYKSNNAAKVLIGMVVNDQVLATITANWSHDKFETRQQNLIGKWCVEHYQKYNCAPRKDIEHYFGEYETASPKMAPVALMSQVLESINDDYELAENDINAKVLIDKAAILFDTVAAGRLGETLTDLSQTQNNTEIHKVIADWKPANIGKDALKEGMGKTEIIKCWNQPENDIVLSYPGAIGQMFGKQFYRGAFVAFMGPEKRGKSFWLMDVAVRAVLNRKRVMFFEMGDMSETERNKRYTQRVCRQPLKSTSVKYPISIVSDTDRDTMAHITFKQHDKRGMSIAAAKRGIKRLHKRVRSKRNFIKFSYSPCMSSNVDDIEATMKEIINDDWAPDMVVIDYPDIMSAPLASGSMDRRDQYNQTWARLRGIASQYNCCVVVATQADAASYGSRLIRRHNFSEDKRKLSHVTSMFGLNQTDDEKEAGIMRINCLLARDASTNESRVVHVATCFSIADPCVASTW